MSDMTSIEKLAHGVMALKEKYEELEKIASNLFEENERFKKRERAEEVLISAQDKDCKLKTASVDDFISQRSILESKSYEELEKMAGALDFLEEGSGFFVSDLSDGNDRMDFTGWLDQINGDLQ